MPIPPDSGPGNILKLNTYVTWLQHYRQQQRQHCLQLRLLLPYQDTHPALNKQ
jgi:hypothetical protein